MSKPIILFDIDKTLFNTPQAAKSLMDLIDQNLDRLGLLSRFNAETLLREYLAGLEKTSQFQLKKLVRLIELRLVEEGVAKDKVSQLYQNIINHVQADFLYQDVLPSIKLLHQSGFSLGIFSQSSDQVWQRNKIKQLLLFLNQDLVFIAEDKLDPLVLNQLPQTAVIIDDKPEVIKALLAFARENKRNWQVYLIDRHDLVDQTTKEALKAKGVKVVFDLEELVSEVTFSSETKPKAKKSGQPG